MSQFNVLSESFITNSAVSGHPFRALSVVEISNLIVGSGAVALSGAAFKLTIDLAAQKDVEKLVYSFSPVTTSGLTIKYGRTPSSLTTATLNSTPSSIEVFPTQSGYTYPRYFEITHTASGVNSFVLQGLSVLNQDSDVLFSGASNTVIAGEFTAGYSTPVSVDIVNSGNIPSDLYVTLDTYDMSLDTLERLEISTTATGTFLGINSELVLPDDYPFHWGSFSGTTITDNALRVRDPANAFRNFVVGSEYGLVAEAQALTTNKTHSEPCLTASGRPCIARIRTDHRIELVDPLINSRTLSTTAPYTPANVDEQENTHLAWDGGSRLYYCNGSTNRNLYYYNIANNTFNVFKTLSFYNRQSRPVAYHQGYVYIGGATATSGTSATLGSQFWRVNITTSGEQQLTDLPATPDADGGGRFTVLNNAIYYAPGGTNAYFGRYNVTAGTWEQLANLPGSTNAIDLHTDSVSQKVSLIRNNGTTYEYDPVSGLWAYTGITFSTNDSDAGALTLDGSMYYFSAYGTSVSTNVYVRREVTYPVLNPTVSGVWLSPVFRLNADDFAYKPVIYINSDSGAYLRYDTSLGVDNFEVRGSDSSPSADNYYQEFQAALDPEEFYSSTLSESTDISVSGSRLNFSHVGTTGASSAGFIYYGFPFNSTGEMQYKFWWNPATAKKSGSTYYSRFLIVPYIDTIGEGALPTRSATTLLRTQDNFIYLAFGQASDTAGSFSRLQFFNGATTVTYNISAFAGTDYEVILLINWETGAYSIYFDSSLVGSGTIPSARLALLNPQHSFEIFSAGEDVTFDEKYSHLSINRNTLQLSSEDAKIVPLHRNDPLFGISGSLQWVPATVNTTLLPATEYTQFRFTLKNSAGADLPTVTAIKFLPILRFKDVMPGDSRRVYLRYLFPAASTYSTETVRLKAWLRADKT